MVRKLQLKFIIIATVAIAIILTAILSMVNIYNFIRVQSQIVSVMELITEYGFIPDEEIRGRNADDLIPDQSVSSSPEGESPRLFIRNYDLNRESYYQIRYYIARFDPAGELESLDIEHIAALDDKEASELAKTFLKMAENEGFLFDNNKGRLEYNGYTYSYLLTEFDDASSMLVVLDCTSDISNARAFLAASLWFGILCVAVFVIIVSVLSKRILRPVIQNIENQKTFITNAGHELKTPVAIISANAEVMEMISGKNEWTESIMQQTKRLSELISNLITLSKISEKNNAVILEDTDISVITKERAESFRPIIEQQGKTLEVRVDENVHAVVEKNTYGELVNILMDNAAKYCDENGKVTLTLSRAAQKKGIRLVVSNTYAEGKSVDYSKFFQRFYRADASHNSNKGGYGIGLSMAEQIVELSKGKIKAEWKDGVISFIVTF